MTCLRTYPIRQVLVCLSFIVFGGTVCVNVMAQTTKLEISSSPNPVGSGARALGMGGAFIGVADDATAASWNPGGLVQLPYPEISLVYHGLHRVEDNLFTDNPEAGGAQSITETDLNYLSVVYPFNLLDRNMIVSLNYQHLYDFYREWDFQIEYTPQGIDFGDVSTRESLQYRQDGSLSALGLAYCIQIIPELSMGVTLNFWDDDLMDNEWRSNRKTRADTRYVFPGMDPIISTTYGDDEQTYHFSGFNFNFGLLWRATSNLNVGLVIKSPFTADLSVEKTNTISTPESPEPVRITNVTDEEMDMPLAYGIGLAWRLSDQMTLSADLYRTEWGDLSITDSKGRETSPVTGKPLAQSDVDPTHQVRVGMEYLILNPEKGYVVPLRAGIFYDPSPSEGAPDDYFGFSLGSGIALGRFVFDLSYQFRHGDNVNTSRVQLYTFEQEIDEHMVYSSLILHL